jgi:hypothetical protein
MPVKNREINRRAAGMRGVAVENFLPVSCLPGVLGGFRCWCKEACCGQTIAHPWRGFLLPLERLRHFTKRSGGGRLAVAGGATHEASFHDAILAARQPGTLCQAVTSRPLRDERGLRGRRDDGHVRTSRPPCAHSGHHSRDRSTRGCAGACPGLSMFAPLVHLE